MEAIDKEKSLDEGMDYPEEQRIYDINGNGILRRIIWLPTATEISKGLLQQYFHLDIKLFI